MLDPKNTSQAVSELLLHGSVTTQPDEEWFDYVGHYGLTASDIPALLRLTQDAHSEHPLSDEETAIHACRALGLLGDDQAASGLVQLLDDTNHYQLIENALVALSLLGTTSLEALKRFFAAPKTAVWSQIEALAGIRIFALKNPRYRDECVTFLTTTLEKGTKQAAMLNGFLVFNLIELMATEAADEIALAFHENRVDENVSGRWPDVQIQLGLARAIDFSPDALMYAGELYPLPTEAEMAEIDLLTESLQRPRPILSHVCLAESYSIAEHLMTQRK